MKEKIMVNENSKEMIKIPPIQLEWSDWIPWSDLVEGRVEPPNRPGVYKVKYKDAEELLFTGESSNLRRRIKYLTRGRFSIGKKICSEEDVSRIVLGWAVTNRPAAVEEELRLNHLNRFGRLPKYTRRTW